MFCDYFFHYIHLLVMNTEIKNEKNLSKQNHQCLEFGKTFDNDCKQKHEETIHNSKKSAFIILVLLKTNLKLEANSKLASKNIGT